MSFTLTSILLGLGVFIFGVSAWRSSLRADPMRGVRLIPWRFITLLSAVYVLVILAHFVSFFGIQTGGRW